MYEHVEGNEEICGAFWKFATSRIRIEEQFKMSALKMNETPRFINDVAGQRWCGQVKRVWTKQNAMQAMRWTNTC